MRQTSDEEPILPRDRHGVLHPANLPRFAARRYSPSPAAATLVDGYWEVSWRLPPGESIRQRVIEFPAITLTLESGEVPAPLVLTGVHSRAWVREISGEGTAFGIRLRPAGIVLLGGLTPQQVADRTVPVTADDPDPAVHALLVAVARAGDAAGRIRLMDDHAAAAASRAGELHLLANRVVDRLLADVHRPGGAELAGLVGAGERSVQRALRATLGRGPTWVARRIRLQEVARLLATRPDLDITSVAADLGYTDQAHLTTDFRGVAGVTPAAYRRSVVAGS
ncbi:helix-turn-helix domain-containing protein [Nakamurella alba]|uniref:helix-turn-helix domain-containing protein n=1 Tax=Nakamurella alba TaxID=2665158 RepID=UPI002AC344E0|nr:helix-turn-helix domain-containing protein [Nakamurella alba]